MGHKSKEVVAGNPGNCANFNSFISQESYFFHAWELRGGNI